MEQIIIDFEKTNRGYIVTINKESVNFCDSRDAAWQMLQTALDKADFTETKIILNKQHIPSMDRLVVVIKNLF